MPYERGFIVPSVEVLLDQIERLRRTGASDEVRRELHRQCSRKLRHYPLDRYLARFPKGPEQERARERWRLLRDFVSSGGNLPDPAPAKMRESEAGG